MQACPCDSYYIDYYGRICKKKCCDINVDCTPCNCEWEKVSGTVWRREVCPLKCGEVNIYINGKVVFARSLSITEVAEAITFLAGKK